MHLNQPIVWKSQPTQDALLCIACEQDAQPCRQLQVLLVVLRLLPTTAFVGGAITQVRQQRLLERCLRVRCCLHAAGAAGYRAAAQLSGGAAGWAGY